MCAVRFHRRRRRSNNNGARTARRENDAPETSWERFNEDINCIRYAYTRARYVHGLFCEEVRGREVNSSTETSCANTLRQTLEKSKHPSDGLLGHAIRRGDVRYVYLPVFVRATDLLDVEEIARCCGTSLLVEFSACGIVVRPVRAIKKKIIIQIYINLFKLAHVSEETCLFPASR